MIKLQRITARPGLVEEVYQALLDAISDGSLEPGTHLKQEEIAEQMQVSRSPVLKALLLLKKDGFVQDAPGRGVMVAPMDATAVSNLYMIRGALDALAARLAAERRYQIDPEILAAGRRVIQGTDVKAMIEMDMAFHQAIYQASGNPLIAESAAVYWAHLRQAMGLGLQVAARRKPIWDEHEAIAKAIAEGDAPRAAELSEMHMTRAREFAIELLGGLPEEQ